MANEPQRLNATGADAGRSCPYCRFPLKEGGELVRCGHCHAPHHADCWDENQGCAVLGCAGAPSANTSSQPTVVIPPPPPPSTPAATDKSAQSPNRSSGTNRAVVGAILALTVAIAAVAVVLLMNHSKSPSNALAANRAAQNTTPVTTSAPPATVTETVAATTPATTTTDVAAATTTTIPPVTNTAQPVDHGARTALNQYWQDMGADDYTGAYALESSKEQSGLSESQMAEDNAAVNVIWTKPAVPAPSNPYEATVEINFFAQNQSGSDQNCRHFVLNELMVNSGGRWLYGGPSGTYLAAVANGNSSCPA